MLVGKTGKPGDRAISHEDRAAELRREDEKRKKQRKTAVKNHDFYMVFKAGGSKFLRDLISESAVAARLYLYLAENINRQNAVVASGRTLAKCLEVHESQISKALTLLAERGYLVRLKTGGSNILVLNPDVIWNSWSSGKSTCWFHDVSVLVSKDEQPAAVRRQLAVLVERFKAGDGPEALLTAAGTV